ncbi:MAG: aromatic ring-hydroxylating dioxygenase subunit alpha [Calothrix sp. MO_192.B10]|nr:aromatic ring-hydroxylating dioxygenase subunit alpha [Calothrix sp. MO_192.B10]
MVKLTNNWYIACTSNELKNKPIARTILGIPLVIFRGNNNKPTAFLDRCPHRHIPLSQGWLKNHHLICRYHGWRFDERGICQEIPALCQQNRDKKRNAIAYPIIEQDNFIWVYCQPDEIPQSQPYKFPCLYEKGFSTFTWQMQCQTSLENAAENFLDATHTHFIHTGLIRKDGQRKEITVKVTRHIHMVEAVYLNEENISGWIYKLLAPGCQSVISIGRFILPSIAQLEYQTDNPNYKLFISLFLTPVQENLTQAYGVATFRWGLPNWLGKIIAQPLFYLAAQQDKYILELQSANINRFQEVNFTDTEIDIMRPHINYLLQKNGIEKNSDRHLPKLEKTVKMRV